MKVEIQNKVCRKLKNNRFKLRYAPYSNRYKPLIVEIMTKNILIIVCLLLQINLSAQWYPQNPYPTANNLYSTTFPSDSIGYAVGDNRCIMKSIDGGTSWNVINVSSGINTRLTSVFFISISVGFVCGINYFAKTTDGGITWNTYTIENAFYNSVFFINEWIGFLTDENGSVKKTTDGGTNWTSQQLNVGILRDIYFTTSNTGYCVGIFSTMYEDYGKIFKTENCGESWIEIETISKGLNAIRFVNDNIGFSVGDRGLIVTTQDGGLNWNEQNLCDSCRFTSVAFMDSSLALVAGYKPYWFGSIPRHGVIYKSVDGGISWNQVTIPYAGPLTSITTITDSSLYTVGHDGTLLYSYDLGDSWESVSNNVVGGDMWLYGINFLDTLTGIIVGQAGTVLKTTDGGENWSLLETNYSGSIREFCFIDANTLIANTDYGIFKSNDGGYNWEQKFNIPTWHVDFINSDIGFATEFSNLMTGKLFKSIDGGENWFLSKEFNERVHEIQFLDENTGYVLGMYSVYKTLNGGDTWIKKGIGTNSLLYSFYFTDQSTGFAVGDASRVYKTVDGGDTWTMYNLPGCLKLSIRFINDSIGIIVANGGNIFKTDDAGNHWFSQESTTSNMLESVALLPNGLAYAVGSSSTILRTENYGGEGTIIVSVDEPRKYIHHNYELLLYPNPTFGSIIIEYELTEYSIVDIVITNINGVEIQHLAKDMKNIGTHNVEVNLNKRKAGIYFCIITINGQKEVVKIIKTNGL